MVPTPAPRSPALASFADDASHDSQGNKDTEAFEKMVALDQKRKGFMGMRDNLAWRIFFQLSHTILPTLLTHWLFIGCIVGFAVVRAMVLLDYIPVDDSEFRGVGILGGAVTFFIVFYSGNTYQRFADQYSHAMNAGSEVQQISVLARASLPEAHARRVVRQINAAHVLAYVAIESDCTAEFLRGFNRKIPILTEEEMKVVMKMDLKSSGPMSALVSWIVMDISKSTADGAIDVAEATRNGQLHLIRGEQISCKAVAVKSHLMRLFHFREQPMPFLYVHLATLLTFVYLPLLSIALGISPTGHSADEIWEIQNAAALVFSIIFFLGLRETARLLSDPFGNDDFDFPMIGYSIDTITACRGFMGIQDAEPISVRFEEASNNVRVEEEAENEVTHDGDESEASGSDAESAEQEEEKTAAILESSAEPEEKKEG